MKKNAKRAPIFAAAIAGGLASPLRSDAALDPTTAQNGAASNEACAEFLGCVVHVAGGRRGSSSNGADRITSTVSQGSLCPISDGGDIRGEALSNAELAKKRRIPIFTVGIGDPRHGATIPSEDGRGDQKFNGEVVRVKLEESALKAIAEASRGRYVPLATAGTAETTLGAIYQRFLRQVAAKEQNEEAERAAERYQVFLLPGICLLVAGAALSRGRFGKGKSARADRA